MTKEAGTAESSNAMAYALELRDVHKKFGAAHVIRGVNLVIPCGERHAIIGPNGAGKSTLFNLVSGRCAPTSGDIRVNGVDTAGRSPFELYRSGLSRSFQVTNIYPRLSVYENIRCSVLWALGYRYNFWRPVAALRDVNERIEQTLEQIGLTHRETALAGVLTYAEQRALEIGITIAGGSMVILLDEPTAGMSGHESERAVELIRTISDGRTLVIVEHDMGVVFNLAHRISVLVHGAIIATDVPESIRRNDEVQTAYLGATVNA